MLSDFFPHGKVAQSYGVLRSEGYTERAIFVMDKQGVIRYVDVHDISKQPDNEELFRVLAEIEPRTSTAVKAPEPAAWVEPDADVVMYCTSWCPACARARAFLQEHGIEYVEVNIARERTAAARVREWASGNETTPTFNIRGTIIVDFQREKLAEVLGIARK